MHQYKRNHAFLDEFLQSGILSCFFQGFSTVLFRSMFTHSSSAFVVSKSFATTEPSNAL